MQSGPCLVSGVSVGAKNRPKRAKLGKVTGNHWRNQAGFSSNIGDAHRSGNSASGGHCIVELEGTKSNKDGVGAFVEATIGKKKIIRHMIANNGTAQSQKALHFGLGKAKKVNKLVVSWPSGEKQVLKRCRRFKIYRQKEI